MKLRGEDPIGKTRRRNQDGVNIDVNIEDRQNGERGSLQRFRFCSLRKQEAEWRFP